MSVPLPDIERTMELTFCKLAAKLELLGVKLLKLNSNGVSLVIAELKVCVKAETPPSEENIFTVKSVGVLLAKS